MNTDVQNFLDALVAKYDSINEIWWFGSRANTKDVKANSDWDFLVFANQPAYPLIKRDAELSLKAKELIIGLLVESEGDKFESPWEHQGRHEKLTLADLKWNIISENVAEYWGYIKDENDADTNRYIPEWMKPRNKEEEKLAKEYPLEWGGPPLQKKLNALRVWSAKSPTPIILEK